MYIFVKIDSMLNSSCVVIFNTHTKHCLQMKVFRAHTHPRTPILYLGTHQKALSNDCFGDLEVLL